MRVLRYCEELLAVSCQLTLQACNSPKFNMWFHSKIVQIITLTFIWVTMMIILIKVSREFPPSLLKNAGPVWQLARALSSSVSLTIWCYNSPKLTASVAQQYHLTNSPTYSNTRTQTHIMLSCCI
jgi:hypothetical protein